MKTFIKQYLPFLLVSFLALALLGTALIFTDKASLHLWFNSCHNAFGDFFFRYYTLLGEFAIYIVAVVLLFKKQYLNTLFVLLSEGISALMVQIIKHSVNMPRPKIFFDLASNPDILPVVSGVHLHSWHSFPSGHTASFAVLMFCLCILLTNKQKPLSATNITIQVVLALLLLLGGFSRIYLSQHFAEDVLVGGLLGLTGTALAYVICSYIRSKKHN